MFEFTLQTHQNVQALMHWVSRAVDAGLLISLFFLGFGLQTYDVDHTSCIHELDAEKSDSPADFANLLIMSVLALVFEFARMAHAKFQRKQYPPPAGARIITAQQDEHREKAANIILEAGTVVFHLVTWIYMGMLHPTIKDTVIKTSNTVCATSGIDIKSSADWSLYIAIASLALWVLHFAYYWMISDVNAADYNTSEPVDFFDIRLGTALRMLAAIVVCAMSAQVFENNFTVAKFCANNLVFPSTVTTIICSIFIIVFCIFGCDAIVEIEGTRKYKVRVWAVTKVVAIFLGIFTLTWYIMLQLQPTDTQRADECTAEGFKTMENYPFDAFIAAWSLVGAMYFLEAVGYENVFREGRIPGFSTEHKAQGAQEMIGLGLRPTDMATERLTHDKPKRTGGMQFV